MSTVWIYYCYTNVFCDKSARHANENFLQINTRVTINEKKGNFWIENLYMYYYMVLDYNIYIYILFYSAGYVVKKF